MEKDHLKTITNRNDDSHNESFNNKTPINGDDDNVDLKNENKHSEAILVNYSNTNEFDMVDSCILNKNGMKKYSNNNDANEKIIKKHMGALGGFSMIVGVIIGSGIFISVMKTLQVFSPSLGILSFLWVFGGLIALFGGLSYVQLGIMIPSSGGERTYLSLAFGRQVGIIFTIGYCFIVKTLALAGISQTFGKYFVEMLRPNYNNLSIMENIIAAIAIMILFVINSFSTSLANRTQILFTILKLLAISGVIVIGMVFLAIGKGYNDPSPFQNPFKVDTLRSNLIATALINIFWAYEGWNSLGAIVGEMKHPKKDLPISVVFGTIVVTIVYCLTIVSYVAVLGYNTVENTETVAAVFATKTIPKAKWIIPLFICISTFGACNGTLLSLSRIVMTAAFNRDIPGIFGLVHHAKRTPIFALLVPSIISMIFLLLPFQQLVKYFAFISWFFYGLTMASCIKLNWSHNDLDHSFKLPTFFPFAVLIVSVYIVIMCFINNFKESIIIALVMAAVYGIHFLPDRMLKPALLKKTHSRVKNYFCKWYHLEMVTKDDIG